MISNYKFQDLAQLVNDLKFLMARGGGPTDRLTKMTAMLEVVTIIFWHVLKFVVVLIVLYTMYHLVFKGYPRFPLDLSKWKFYNKLNFKAELSSNNLLYNNLNDLATDEGLMKAFKDYSDLGLTLNTTNVFSKLLTNIMQNYSEGFKDDKHRVEAAMKDYFAYYDVITDKLGLKGMDLSSKRSLLMMLKQDVFNNFVKIDGLPTNFAAFYDLLMDKEFGILCLANDGKNAKKRDSISKKKKQLRKNLNELMDRYNIVKVETVKNFAKKFMDPEFVLNDEKSSICKRQDNVVNNYLITNPDFIELQKKKQDALIDLKKLEIILKHVKGRTKENKNKKKALVKQIKDIDQQLMKLQAVATSNADKLQQQMSTVKNPVQFSKVSDLISVKDGQPDITSTSDSSKYFSVFVPCYDIYSSYYEENKDKYKHLENLNSNSDKGLTEKEIIAYIFLSDLQNINNRKQGKANVDIIVIEKILDIYLGIEEVIDTSRKIITVNQKDLSSKQLPPKSLLQFISFPDESAYSRSVAEFYSIIDDKKTATIALTAYQTDKQEVFDKLGVTEEYTYYLLELYYCGMNPNAFKHFRQLSDFDQRQPNVVSFINLPPELRNTKTIQDKMEVSEETLQFIKHHPLFTWVFLHPEYNTDNVYKQVLAMLSSGIFGLPFGVGMGVINVEEQSLVEFQKLMKDFQKRIHNMKKIIIASQMMYMFFVVYRDDVLEKDKQTKMKVVQNGYVSLYNEQNVSYYVEPFFKRLFKPFKLDFIDGRIYGTWRRTLTGFFRSRNHPNSFWREFKALYIDRLGKIMDQMLKSFWKKLRSMKA